MSETGGNGALCGFKKLTAGGKCAITKGAIKKDNRAGLLKTSRVVSLGSFAPGYECQMAVNAKPSRRSMIANSMIIKRAWPDMKRPFLLI
jgi:hypothetical protein